MTSLSGAQVYRLWRVEFGSLPTLLIGQTKTEPEWPGVLTESDIKLDGDKLGFVGTGKGDEMALTMTWTSTARPDDPNATPSFSGTWTFVPRSPAPTGQLFQSLWGGDT